MCYFRSPIYSIFYFFFIDTATTEIYTLSLHDALPISRTCFPACWRACSSRSGALRRRTRDRKSTRLNSSHVAISYAVFCLKKKKALEVSRLGQGGFSSSFGTGIAFHPSLWIRYYYAERRRQSVTLCLPHPLCIFFFNDTATTEIYTLSLHDALPI